MNIEKLIQEALECGILDIENLKQEVDMIKRKEILENHKAKITPPTDKCEYWQTHGSSGKRLKAKTQKALEDKIVKDYENVAQTVDDLFNEWLQKKNILVENGKRQKSTIYDYQKTYKRHFETFKKKKVEKITKYQVEQFLIEEVRNKNLTIKGYNKIKTIILGIFKLAYRKELIDYRIDEVISDIPKEDLIFAESKEKECYTLEETKQIIKYCFPKDDLRYLGVCLLPFVGPRIGELSTIELGNLTLHTIRVKKTETTYRDDDGKIVHDVRDGAKTKKGNRNVIIPKEAEPIVEKILELSKNNKKYIFEEKGKRLAEYQFRNVAKVACKNLNIKYKGLHSFRAVYASLMYEKVSEAEFLDQMGHTDIGVYRSSYQSNLYSEDQTREKMSGVFKDFKIG